MLYALLNKNDICTGSTSKKDNFRPEYIEGCHGKKWTGSEWIDPKSLDEYKADGMLKIKYEANQRISSLDWELQRVEERKARGKKMQSDVDIVLNKRESIRIASDEAEARLNALTTIEEVKAFNW